MDRDLRYLYTITEVRESPVLARIVGEKREPIVQKIIIAIGQCPICYGLVPMRDEYGHRNWHVMNRT